MRRVLLRRAWRSRGAAPRAWSTISRTFRHRAQQLSVYVFGQTRRVAYNLSEEGAVRTGRVNIYLDIRNSTQGG